MRVVAPRVIAGLCTAFAIGFSTPDTVARGQNPAPIAGPTTPVKPSTGLIVGQLVDGSSGAPVSTAVVTLVLTGPSGPSAPGPPAPPPQPGAPLPGPRAQRWLVLTDGNGRFMFHSLAAGTYTLSASRPGYLLAQYGQLAPNAIGGGPGRPIELADGQRLSTIAIKIWKYASIAGRLVDETGEPAVDAMLQVVRVSGPPSARRYSMSAQARTDDRGIYRFGDLPPGEVIVMMPSSVISVPMAVVDAYADANTGNPARNPVAAAIQSGGGSVSSSGQRIGDQLVATLGEGMPQFLIDAAGKMSVYPTTFFPGTRAISSATVLTLDSGQERTGVDFGLRPVPAATVTGQVAGPDGPVPNMVVKLVPVEAEILFSFSLDATDVASSVTRADGTFTVLGVPAGNYTATVLRVPAPVLQPSQPTSVINVGGGTSSMGSMSSTSPAAPTDPVLWGRAAVTVADKNVDGVAIRLAMGATVSGRVEFEAGSILPLPTPDQLQRARVLLSPIPAGPTLVRTQNPPLAADGSFKTQGYPPGRYNMSVSLPAPGWVMRSMLIGSRGGLDQSVDLAGPDVTGVVITFTDKVSEISGSITGTDASLGVLLLPANYQAWIQGGMSSRPPSTGATPDGTYRLTGVLAGEYIIVALGAQTAQQALQDPQIMTAIAKQGTRITIGDREKRTLALTVVQVKQP